MNIYISLLFAWVDVVVSSMHGSRTFSRNAMQIEFNNSICIAFLEKVRELRMDETTTSTHANNNNYYNYIKLYHY